MVPMYRTFALVFFAQFQCQSLTTSAYPILAHGTAAIDGRLGPKIKTQRHASGVRLCDSRP